MSVPEQVHKQLYLIVEAGEPRLCGFVPAVSAMTGEEVLALPSQCVYASVQVDVQLAGIVDCELRLHRQESLSDVHGLSLVGV